MFGNSELIPGFFVFEGLDGSGTSTQLRILEKQLEHHRIPFLTTFEPTDGPIGRLIRQILSGQQRAEAETLARLYAADRHEHIFGGGGVLEAIRQGKLVVSDRYFYSSLAYQGELVGMDRVWNMNRDFPLPEAVLFFDIPPVAAEKRYSQRETPDIFEKREFQEKVRSRYEEVFARFEGSPTTIHRIDSLKSIEEIQTEVWRIIASSPIVKE